MTYSTEKASQNLAYSIMLFRACFKTWIRAIYYASRGCELPQPRMTIDHDPDLAQQAREHHQHDRWVN